MRERVRRATRDCQLRAAAGSCSLLGNHWEAPQGSRPFGQRALKASGIQCCVRRRSPGSCRTAAAVQACSVASCVFSVRVNEDDRPAMESGITQAVSWRACSRELEALIDCRQVQGSKKLPFSGLESVERGGSSEKGSPA